VQLPTNVQFEIDDFESEWTYPEGSFDYIHVRSLFGCVQDWPRFYAQCMRYVMDDELKLW